MSNLNIAALFLAGRAKSMTELWSDVEHRAVFELGIPPELVRKGFLTVEGAKSAQEEIESSESLGERPLIKMSYAELANLAGKVGALFRDGMEYSSLVSSVRLALEAQKAAGSQEEPREEAEEASREAQEGSFRCIECDFEAKSAAGLKAHSRKHAKEGSESEGGD